MATYTEKLWGSSSGTYPTSILTKRWVTTNETVNACVSDTDAEGGYLLESEWSANGRRLNSWDVLDSVSADTELLVRFRFEGTNRDDAEFGLALRASGAAGSENGYSVQIFEGGTNDLFLDIREYSSGTATSLTTSSDILFDVGTEWLWCRFRANGATISAKLWRDREDEPTSWQATTTDSTHSSAGWNGLWYYRLNYRTDVDYMSAGTAGDTAPLTASTTTALRNTLTNAHVLTQTDNPVVRSTVTNAHVLKSSSNPTIRSTVTNVHVLHSVIPPPETRITTVGAQVLTQDSTPETRVTTVGAQVLTQDTTPETRITTVGAQVLHSLVPPPEVRTTTVGAGVLLQDSTPETRTTTVGAGVLLQDSAPETRTTSVGAGVLYKPVVYSVEVRQEFVESLYTGTADAEIRQEFVESLYTGTADAEIRQEFVEVLWSEGGAYPYHVINKRRKAINALLTR